MRDGAHLKDATITQRKAGKGQQEYLIVKMNDVIITGVALSDTSGEAGSETVTLAFAQVDLEYKPLKADGSLEEGIISSRHPSPQRRLRTAFDWRPDGGPAWTGHGTVKITHARVDARRSGLVDDHSAENGQFDGAHELYRRVSRPRLSSSCVALLRCARASTGRNDEALALIERSLALVPDQADWWSNLGIVFQSDDRLDSAMKSYRRAIAVDPSHANAHNNLGVFVLRAIGQPIEAEAGIAQL